MTHYSPEPNNDVTPGQWLVGMGIAAGFALYLIYMIDMGNRCSEAKCPADPRPHLIFSQEIPHCVCGPVLP
jgi:hypothetical protein